MMFRVGVGFDVHRFKPATSADNKIALGAVMIPCKYAIEAHSDGDVILHALVDAMLGALALGDIGDHFPPSDMKWKDANSVIFLKHAASLVAEKGWQISNIDTVVMAEQPRLKDYKLQMAQTIADILGLNIDQVSIKATTTEKMGFTGREEGIAATVNCLLFRAS